MGGGPHPTLDACQELATEHPRARPGSPTKRWYLIDLANDLSHDRGLLTIATILPEPAPSQRKRQLAETVREHLAERKVDALVRVVSAPTPYVGASVLVEAYGLGGLVPNTGAVGRR